MNVAKTVRLESPFPHADNSRPLLDPDRIRCARETAGFSKVELAKLLSVTPRTISNYEEEGAPLGKARSLADVLGVNPSFFTGLPGDPSIEDLAADRVWFRSLRKSSARRRKSAIGHGRNALLFFHWITDHFMLPDNDLPDCAEESISPKQCAAVLRDEWGYGENPLPSMLNLAEAHGIRAFSMPDVDREVDAFSFVFDGVPYIAVDTHKTPERIRFDIAHEVGHLLMHEAMFTEADRAVRDAEKEAHDFAANLLMPERRVEALLPHHASLQQILEAKRYFRVSAFAMAYRAHTLGRLTDWEYRSVCSELSARGYRTGEPKGIPMETSQVFTFIAQSNHAKGISTSTIAEETGLSTKELHGLSFGNLIAVTGGNESAKDSAGSTARPQLTLHVNTRMNG